MTIAIRKEQIIRIKKASFQSELNEVLEKRIRDRVVATVKTIIAIRTLPNRKVAIRKETIADNPAS